jgi:hypothetical protein
MYPDFLNQEMGLDFSEPFHTDPVYRNQKWKEVVRWVHQRFGRWGCGAENPPDAYSVTTLASVHFTAFLFGSRVSYWPDRFPDTHDYPLAGIPDLCDFRRSMTQAEVRIQQAVDEAKRLVDRFGPEQVVIPYYSEEDVGMRDLEFAHCPLTISYRLLGERLLLEMYDNPEGVEHFFSEIMSLSLELGERFREVVGKGRPSQACVAACASCFLGPDLFRRYLMPRVIEFAAGRPLLFHACGNVNSLFKVFKEMAARSQVRVFDCREEAGIDVKRAAEAFPHATISYMFSPPACLSRTAGEMREAIRETIEKSEDRSVHLILNLPAGAKDEIVDTFFETCGELGVELPQEAGLAFT